MIQLSEMYRYL